MSHVVHRNARLLEFLCKLPAKHRNKLIEYFDQDLVRSVHEIAHNTVRSNIPLSKSHKIKLKKFKKIIKTLATPSRRWRLKKKYIKQVGGGFLPYLIAPVISTLLQSVLNS